MRIESYSINAASTHLYRRRESFLESWGIGAIAAPGGSGRVPSNPSARIIASVPEGPAFSHRPQVKVASRCLCPGTEKEGTDPRLAGLKALVEKMVEALTGKKIRIRLASFPPSNGNNGHEDSTSSAAPRRRSLPVVEYRYLRELVEEERTVYAVSGKVMMVDGREISFRLVVSMERQRAEYESMTSRFGGEPTDPLVVVLDGSYARLSEMDIDFDLDLDGLPDRLPLPEPGSGYLVLDLNGDGLVNDGNELFGPRTGNGFSELALHDVDGNGWIDEADSVFQDLRVWVWQDGVGKLLSLSELKIGALYLKGMETPFTLTSAEGERGRIATTSFWLGEDGRAGLVQHLDLFL